MAATIFPSQFERDTFLGARPATWGDYEFFKSKLWAAAGSCDEFDSAIRRLLKILGL